HRVATPAQVAKREVLVGMGQRDGCLEIAILLVTLDECIADQDHAIAVLESERQGGIEGMNLRTEGDHREQNHGHVDGSCAPGGREKQHRFLSLAGEKGSAEYEEGANRWFD